MDKLVYNPKLRQLTRYHASMLNDNVRNQAFYQSLKKYITNETRVLDIGAGTGVWSILAAKLGAKRVVAIEEQELLIPIIKEHIIENGVSEKVEVVEGNSKDVKIKGKFDLIISETIGNEAFDEHIIDIITDAKKRFLAPNGIIIPQTVSMMCAPVNFTHGFSKIPQDIPFSCNFFRSLTYDYSHSWKTRENIKLLSTPKALVEVNLLDDIKPPDFEHLKSRWVLEDIRQANAFVIFANSWLTKDVFLDTFTAESWSVVLYEFEPFDVDSGELELDFTFDKENKRWTVSVLSSPEIKPRTYSPVFSSLKLARKSQKA